MGGTVRPRQTNFFGECFVLNRYLVIALALLLGATSVTASAQNKKRIERADDLPRFS